MKRARMSLSVSCFLSKLELVEGGLWQKVIFNQFASVFGFQSHISQG